MAECVGILQGSEQPSSLWEEVCAFVNNNSLSLQAVSLFFESELSGSLKSYAHKASSIESVEQ